MTPSLPQQALSVDKPTFYKELREQVVAILDPSLPLVSNLANVAAVLYYGLTDKPISRKINWCGFYLTTPTPNGTGKRLVLGPFQGRVACTIIPFGKGVCGTAASTQETQLVPDVHLFSGHIACDSASESEIVAPIIQDSFVVGVLDIDCLVKDGFDQDDRAGMEGIVQEIIKAIKF